MYLWVLLEETTHTLPFLGTLSSLSFPDSKCSYFISLSALAPCFPLLSYYIAWSLIFLGSCIWSIFVGLFSWFLTQGLMFPLKHELELTDLELSNLVQSSLTLQPRLTSNIKSFCLSSSAGIRGCQVLPHWPFNISVLFSVFILSLHLFSVGRGTAHKYRPWCTFGSQRTRVDSHAMWSWEDQAWWPAPSATWAVSPAPFGHF